MKARFLRYGTALAVSLAAVLLLTGAAKLTRKAASKPPDLPLIVLDAGHGGFDGGAVAADGTLEKDINLAVVRKLDVLLRAMGFETLLIRDEDESVETESGSLATRKRSDIRHRFDVMNENEGCVYLCVHQNFYTGRGRGAQVFYTAGNAEAQALAGAIQTAVVEDLQPRNKRQIKPCTSDVYLIYHARQTAVLVECGFLSDPNDLRDLKDETYQRKLSFAIAKGLAAYLNGRDTP